MNSASFAKLFPFGAHLCRKPMPPLSELKHDMEVLKRNGFNLIKLQEHWMLDEPVEGKIDLAPYEELIRHAARLDMGVYIGFTCEQAPGWLYRKYPDCRMVRRDGVPVIYEAQTTLPADGKPGPCYDHPEANAEQARFIDHVVRRLGRFENVVVWNVWQEIGYWAEWTAGGEVCFCDHTLNAFRNWLQAKYGDLDGLNRAWRARYPAWELVAPDRGAYGRYALPQDIDWRYFMEHIQVSNVLQSRVQAIRAADPLSRPIFAHVAAPLTATPKLWHYARSLDFLGSSAYPAWAPFHAWDDGNPRRASLERESSLVAETWSGVALNFDSLRSANPPGKPVWAAEFQGGPIGGFHRGRVPDAADIRRWLLTAVASGVTAVNFWVARAEIMAAEANGFSLLDGEGDSTPRLLEAARIGAALNKHADLFTSPQSERAKIAILMDERNAAFCASMPEGGEHLDYSSRGWHRLLWENGIPVDFLDIRELEDRYAHGYRALVLPYPLLLSEDLAKKLVAYVECGGNLISEGSPGRFDEHGFCQRSELSPTLRELFGVRPLEYALVGEPDDRRWTPLERTWGEILPEAVLGGYKSLAGFEARANVFIQTFTCQGSEPCLLFKGKPAGVLRPVGQGTAWLLGTCLGHNGTAHRDARTRAFVRALLAQCGVTPQNEGRLLLRKRHAPGKVAWILTNLLDEPVSETIVIGTGKLEDLLGEPFERKEGWVRLTVPPLDVRVIIAYS